MPDTMDGQIDGLVAIILAHNEAIHIHRSVSSALSVASTVLVVDSNSTDDTCSIAEGLGARVLIHPWRNYATQFNWAIGQLDPDTKWILRLDADEFLSSSLLRELRLALNCAPLSVAGFAVNRVVKFAGKEILHGGMQPRWMLRVWRYGLGKCEERWMDEHVILEGSGTVDRLMGALIDDNQNPFNWYFSKLNSYSTREVADILLETDSSFDNVVSLSGQPRRIRRLKSQVYRRAPLFLRAFAYAFWRIVLQGGFMDGTRGLQFHLLQCLVYRLMVDAKLYDIRRRAASLSIPPLKVLHQVYGVST